ncbi:MAG TPA: hypothetical protein PKY59_13275 [Pyrinomonadaceae bacterium]|nr:hypothetical protein [Pyrinomonadaceae bacterium]
MKAKISTVIIILAVCGFGFAQEKPPLTEKDLEKNTYYFEISDNKIIGDGAKFLTDELAKPQFVLLGEYHGSQQISVFTKAVIPILHDAGCRTFALEVGPVSAEILGEMSKDSTKTIENLNAFNSKFYVQTKNRTFTPIPFFSNVEDAEFLAEARKRNWNLLGLDQEFSFGYVPLIQKMFENLNAKKKIELKPLYEQVVGSINSFYKASIDEGKSQYKAILDSKEVNDFLEKAAENNPKNKQIADAIRFTTDIYYMNDDKIRKYYAANSGRVNYMKKNLSEGFAKLKFDTKKDKMLLKMGAVHTGRGFSDLSLFEIGNTLTEIASFNRNQSLHIEFGARFYVDNSKEIDALADTKSFDYRYQALLQMSKKDKWTVIDLRPLRSSVFYSRKYKLDEIISEIFKRQDLYIMPPMETDPNPNFRTAK